jgi:hypothetical protein
LNEGGIYICRRLNNRALIGLNRLRANNPYYSVKSLGATWPEANVLIGFALFVSDTQAAVTLAN